MFHYALVPCLSTTWLSPKVSPTLSTNTEVMFLTMITEERLQLILVTIDDKLCKSGNTSDTESLNINIRKMEALFWLSEVFARSHLELQVEEEAFQSPSSTTLWFLVSVLLGFLLKVSPTLSTNSEGIWASLNIFGTLGSELGELQHLQYVFDVVYVMIGDLDDQTDYHIAHHISLKPKVCLLFLEIGADILLLENPFVVTLTSRKLLVDSYFPLRRGNALHALRSRLSDPTNVLQSSGPTVDNPCTCSNISRTLGSKLGELKHLNITFLGRWDRSSVNSNIYST
ncbi:hypothetical protein HHK36_027240 [Tetracentron sinense]|uniref:Uncharacterized protein n=1 Tax=Tetracentron sinense TaxID=13715 RepID=A0A834YI91_TETSI|nr:hypothetical protein HHK36_027240 [Tetracentron sinense]